MGTSASIVAPQARDHAAGRLEAVFRRCFYAGTRTLLVGGQPEPLYQPAQSVREPHRLFYREDYFASALHEVAHWCIAGAERRKRVDFGYWYTPDGRSTEQQRAFETVEDKPQALEWFFCKASNYSFRISVDNLDNPAGDRYDTGPFEQRVLAQARQWQQRGLPRRAAIFYSGLCREFDTCTAPSDLLFDLAELS